MNTNFTLFLIGLLIFFCSGLKAQTKAVTVNGDTIYVYDNGTWSFELLDEMPVVNELDFLNAELQIDTIKTEFTCPLNAKKEVENAEKIFRIKYDDKLWKRVPPATLNDEAEFAFESKKSDIWCAVISEETPILAYKLLLIAKKNMEDFSGTKATSLKTELLKVNGKEVIRGVLSANISGIAFIFDSYYYSNDLGSVQFTTWTSEKVWERNEMQIQDLLHGFIAE